MSLYLYTVKDNFLKFSYSRKIFLRFSYSRKIFLKFSCSRKISLLCYVKLITGNEWYNTCSHIDGHCFCFGIGKSAHMTVIYLGKSVLSLYGVLSIGIVVHPDVITNLTSCLLSINLPTYITLVIQKCWLF